MPKEQGNRDTVIKHAQYNKADSSKKRSLSDIIASANKRSRDSDKLRRQAMEGARKEKEVAKQERDSVIKVNPQYKAYNSNDMTK